MPKKLTIKWHFRYSAFNTVSSLWITLLKIFYKLMDKQTQ